MTAHSEVVGLLQAAIAREQGVHGEGDKEHSDTEGGLEGDLDLIGRREIGIELTARQRQRRTLRLSRINRCQGHDTRRVQRQPKEERKDEQQKIFRM